MAYIKKQEDIALITEGGKKMGEILDALTKLVEPGVSAWEIDQEAERLILEAGGRPAFKGYTGGKGNPPFPSTICACVNEENVHGIATKKKVLKDGDIFSIDIGMQWPVGCGKGKKGNGFFTDTALTLPVGTVPAKTMRLLEVTRKALEIGIEQARPGNTIRDIGKAIQAYIDPLGYGIIRDLVGHGVGHDVHEPPNVPNYDNPHLDEWKIEPGVVIAIEPMITLGSPEVDVADDGWSVITKDKSLNAHFEHTVVVTEEGPRVVTRRPSEL